MNWLSLFIPRRYCLCCGRPLQDREESVCTSCFSQIPFTQMKGKEGNALEKVFWTTIPIERASSLFYYRHDDLTHKLLLGLKYYGQYKAGIYFGEILAEELKSVGFFNGIDMIVPMPLFPKRQRKRGYNQSEEIARGIARQTNLAINTTLVKRVVDNPTQTRKNAAERHLNVEGIFEVKSVGLINGKHILLVDDVITTGATICSCAKAILKSNPNCRFSVLSLAMSTAIQSVPYYEKADEGESARYGYMEIRKV